MNGRNNGLLRKLNHHSDIGIMILKLLISYLGVPRFAFEAPAFSSFRRIRIIAGNQLVEDFDSCNRVHQMFSKMMSQGARKDEANESFGNRDDDEIESLDNEVGTHVDYDVTSTMCPGFKEQMTVGFRPRDGPFSQLKYPLLKYMANFTAELKLVNATTDCVIDPDDYDEADGGIAENLRSKFAADVALPAGNASNTSTQSLNLNLTAVSCACDVSTLSNDLSNECVKHLLKGKGLPITFTTHIPQSQSIKGSTDVNVPVIRRISELVASFITCYKCGDPLLVYEHVDKEFCIFYHPHQSHNEQEEGIDDVNQDLEFQIQIGSLATCNSIVCLSYKKSIKPSYVSST